MKILRKTNTTSGAKEHKAPWYVNAIQRLKWINPRLEEFDFFFFFFFPSRFWRRAWPRCCESSCRIVWFWLSCCYGFNRVLPLPAWHCSPCSGGMQTSLSHGTLSLILRAALQLNLRYQAGLFLVRYLSAISIFGSCFNT